MPEPVKNKIRFEIEDGCFSIINSTQEPIVVHMPKFLLEPLGLHNLTKDQSSVYFNFSKILDTFSIGVNRNSKFVSPKKMELCKQIPGVMVLYANFVQHSIVGNNFYPILKIIPTNINQETKEQQYTSMHFDHLEFIKCNVNYLDNMKFELRGLDGGLIEFGNDRRVVLNIVIKNPNKKL